MFCGARKVDGKAYCARHCRIAYRPREEADAATAGRHEGRDAADHRIQEGRIGRRWNTF
jgi:hypothetical protein